MMIHAYQEIYLNNAQAVLGEAFDYAVNDCGIPGNIFSKYFLVSSVSKKMENGEPKYLAGKSGIELVYEIIDEVRNENRCMSNVIRILIRPVWILFIK